MHNEPVKSYFVERESCPGCGNNHGETLYDMPFTDPTMHEYLTGFYKGGVQFEFLTGARYVLRKCSFCALIYQVNIPNDVLMSRLYEAWIEPKQALVSQRKKDPWFFLGLSKQIANMSLLLGGQPHALSVLDFGMGWGEWCRAAIGFGCTVYGTELSKERIANAKRIGVTIVSWDQIPQYRFDIINAEQVFEHLPDPFGTLTQLMTALRPGGILRISVPDGWDIERRLKRNDWRAKKGTRNSLNPVAPLEHINCFQYGSLVKLAERAGLNSLAVPERCTISVKDTVKSCIKPLYHMVRGSKGTTLHFVKPLVDELRKPISSANTMTGDPKIQSKQPVALSQK